jgi:hypothetical protein
MIELLNLSVSLDEKLLARLVRVAASCVKQKRCTSVAL